MALSGFGDSGPNRHVYSFGFRMPERVLIVDDDPVQRRLLEIMLTRLGYATFAAVGGDEAVRILTADAMPPVDCVVLDLVMPDLDGLGVLERIRAAGVDLPVIVQTAAGGIDNVVSAMRAGANDFVVKPVGAERLRVSLRNALTARALEGELARIKATRLQTGVATASNSAPPPPDTLPLLGPDGQVRPLEEIEAETVRFAIAHYRSHMSEVARRLQIGRSTLYRKLNGLGRLDCAAVTGQHRDVAGG